MPPTNLTQCYICEREVLEGEGQVRDLPYDDYVGQVFICNSCLADEAMLMEGHGDELS